VVSLIRTDDSRPVFRESWAFLSSSSAHVNATTFVSLWNRNVVESDTCVGEVAIVPEALLQTPQASRWLKDVCLSLGNAPGPSTATASVYVAQQQFLAVRVTVSAEPTTPSHVFSHRVHGTDVLVWHCDVLVAACGQGPTPMLHACVDSAALVSITQPAAVHFNLLVPVTAGGLAQGDIQVSLGSAVAVMSAAKARERAVIPRHIPLHLLSCWAT
jgi:hypothetical protein